MKHVIFWVGCESAGAGGDALLHRISCRHGCRRCRRCGGFDAGVAGSTVAQECQARPGVDSVKGRVIEECSSTAAKSCFVPARFSDRTSIGRRFTCLRLAIWRDRRVAPFAFCVAPNNNSPGSRSLACWDFVLRPSTNTVDYAFSPSPRPGPRPRTSSFRATACPPSSSHTPSRPLGGLKPRYTFFFFFPWPCSVRPTVDQT